MKGDYSRFSFSKKKRYSAVLMQQGRLQLDSDWNEQVQISEHRNTALFRDLVGRSGTPKGKAMELELRGSSLFLKRGVYYMDGLFIENDEEDIPVEIPAGNGSFLYYLDAWTQEINAVEDEELVDPAVGQETATRLKTEWRPRVYSLTSETQLAAFRGGLWPEEGKPGFPAELASQTWWRPLSTGWMKLDLKEGALETKDNRLYRIECHGSNPAMCFKWSRNNASLCAEVTKEGDDAYRLAANYVHMEDAFKELSWIELCAPGETTGHLLKAQLENGILRLDSQCPESLKGLSKALIRRWDGVFSEAKSALDELGVTLEYEPKGFYRSGDYWLILVRNGELLNWKSGTKKPPEGVKHHFVALGVVRRTGSGANTSLALEHLRVLFDPLTNPNLSTTGSATIGEDLHVGGNLSVKGYTTTGSLKLDTYSAQANYPVDSRCSGPNGLWYRALQPSGPNNGGAQPLTNTSYWGLADPQLLPTVTTAGTGAAYTITSNLIPTPIPEGFRFRVLFHVANTSTTPTLKINDTETRPLRMSWHEPTGIPIGRITPNSYFDVEYRPTLYVLVGGTIPVASETTPGIVQRATQTEAEAGTDNSLLMTPQRTAQHVTARLATYEQLIGEEPIPPSSVVPANLLAEFMGTAWTRRSGAVSTVNSIAFGNGTFVAVTQNGAIATSPHGTTWTQRTNPVTGASVLNWVTFGNGIFVAVGLNGLILTSSDGITWTQRTNPVAGGTAGLNCVAFGNGTFVACGSRGGVVVVGEPQGVVLTSPNGITWTQQQNLANQLTRVAFGNGTFVALSGVINSILTSSNGTTWTSASWSGQTATFVGVGFGNGTFVVGANNGILITSPNGTNWTQRTHPMGEIRWNDVGFGDGTFAVVGAGGYIIRSSNGTTWTRWNTPWGSDNLIRIAFGNRTFVVSGLGATILTTRTWLAQ